MTSNSAVFVAILVLTVLYGGGTVRAQFDFFQNAIVSLFPSDAEVAVPVSTPPTSELAMTDSQQNSDCVCVPFNTCPSYESNSDGVNLIDVRINLSPCSSYLEVCCNNAPSPTAAAADPDRGYSNGNGEPQVTAQLESAQDYTTTPRPPPVYEDNTPEYNNPSSNPENNNPSSNPENNNPSSNPEYNNPSSNPEYNNPSSNPEYNNPSSNPENNNSPSNPESNNPSSNPENNNSPSNPEYNNPSSNPEYNNTPEPSSSSSTINAGASQSSDGGNTACGTWNRGGIGFRVVNAVNGESQYAEYPSMVAIFREENSESAGKRLFYHCGGSLIKPNVVLTTAHCVIQKDPTTIVVRAGEWDLQTEKEMFMHQDRRVFRIVTHSEYYAGGLHNDIALIFTEEPFFLQETVRTICLPQQNQQFDHAVCFSSGWGKEVTTNNYTISRRTPEGVTHEVGHYNVSILKKVELPIVPRDTCENALRSTRLGPRFRLHESFICAGGEEGKDTCKGDGGSPLMCPSIEDPDILVQVGIVAWGIGCGVHKIPAVYVNVAHFRGWIDTEISATAKK